jgi:hypothetical protein
VSRVVTCPEGIRDEALDEACRKLALQPHTHEPRLTALLAKVLGSGPLPIEAWVGVVVTPPEDGGPGPPVAIIPRANAIDATHDLTGIAKVLREPPPPGRLDVLLAADSVVGVASVDLAPALPVTRAQAEAMHVPAHLLFAKGGAFASVGAESGDVETLLAAWTEHRRLLDARQDDLLEDLILASRDHELRDCAGVLLALSENDQAVTALTRTEARKVVAQHTCLARKLDGRGPVVRVNAGRQVCFVPLVVWAKGHVSVQTRGLVVV